MKYNFIELLNQEIYDTTRVMFILGKYSYFNNMACDLLKEICIKQEESNQIVMNLGDEFGVSNETEEGYLSNSVDFNTFIDVIGVASINGKWYCKVELSMLNKKQKEVLNKYLKNPSPNGILAVVSNNWKDYREYLKNRALLYSKNCHIIQLTFPNKQVLKSIVKQEINSRGYGIDSSAINFFIMRMSSAYEDYPQVLDDICETHKIKLEEQDKKSKKQGKQEKHETSTKITVYDIKSYMKGIENFIVDDFIAELLKPMVSDITNSKKVLKMMIALEDDLTAKELVYSVLNKINEYIELRILINSGYIPVGINFFFNSVIKGLPDNDKKKYENVNEWLFRKKVEIASSTSLKDWEYMKIILMKAIENNRVSESVLDTKCQKALYEVATRSVVTPDIINNIIGIDNLLNKPISKIDNIEFNEDSLKSLNNTADISG